jgi:hypothetical protein
MKNLKNIIFVTGVFLFAVRGYAKDSHKEKYKCDLTNPIGHFVIHVDLGGPAVVQDTNTGKEREIYLWKTLDAGSPIIYMYWAQYSGSPVVMFSIYQHDYTKGYVQFGNFPDVEHSPTGKCVQE